MKRVRIDYSGGIYSMVETDLAHDSIDIPTAIWRAYERWLDESAFWHDYLRRVDERMHEGTRDDPPTDWPKVAAQVSKTRKKR